MKIQSKIDSVSFMVMFTSWSWQIRGMPLLPHQTPPSLHSDSTNHSNPPVKRVPHFTQCPPWVNLSISLLRPVVVGAGEYYLVHLRHRRLLVETSPELYRSAFPDSARLPAPVSGDRLLFALPYLKAINRWWLTSQKRTVVRMFKYLSRKQWLVMAAPSGSPW